MKYSAIVSSSFSWRVVSKQARKAFIVPIMLLLSIFGIKAQNVVDFVITPSANPVNVGQTFTVDITMDMISGEMDAADVRIPFDNTKLNVVSVTRPSTSIFGVEVLPLDPISTMNTNGIIRYAAGTFSNFPTADFVLLTIQFNVIGGSGTNALLQFVAPSGATRNAVQIVNDFGTASIAIQATCTPPTATITNSPTCNGQSFNLVLDAATGVGPFDLVINGTTYNNVAVGGTIATINPPTETLWAPATTPVIVNGNDGQPIEVGTKFTTSVDGYIRGVRMYMNGLTATGTFRGKLYDFATEALLGNAVFTLSGNGWQEVLFSSPVAVTAGTTYLVTCYSSDGFYSATDEYFNGFTLVSGNLTAPAGNGAADNSSNGVFFFGGENFPNQSYQSSSYFVDPVFVAGEFTYNLTSITGDDGCTATGALQTLNVVSTSCSTLPVSLLSLSASSNGSNSIVVKWATSSEQNNKGFEVLRSLDGRNNWQSVGFVNGAGESNSRKDYSFTDANLIARRYYYQLKQVDFDGRYKYTAVVSANLTGKEGFSLEQNFPNPFKSQETTIRFSLPHRSQVQLVVYDMNGRIVKTLVNGVKDAGTHAIPFRDHGLPTGVYFYRIDADGYTDVKKMTVR